MKISLTIPKPRPRQKSGLFIDTNFLSKPKPRTHVWLEVAGELAGLLAIGTLAWLVMVFF